ncbi:MAG: hypothetical protein V3R82_06645 [Candidatus Hydrothermarchaeales archaeon]
MTEDVEKVLAGFKGFNRKAITRSKYVEFFSMSLRNANYDLALLERQGFVEGSGIGRAIKYNILWKL